MNDNELKSALLETWPALPGQEARAWTRLQERMHAPSRMAWFDWRSVLAGGAAVAALVMLAAHFAEPGIAPVSASSQSPGIFATAFYSQPAHAQVVWLNGMDSATDGPTYLDRSGALNESTAAQQPPDSL
jgi:hypothetical protein